VKFVQAFLYTGIIYLLTAVCTEAIHFSSVRCISQDFLHAEPVPCSARPEGLCGNSGSIKKIKRAETYKVIIITALLLQPYRQSQKKPVRSENIVGTVGKHISTIAQNSSAL